MCERVCNLERMNRQIFKYFNKKLSNQHNDCLHRIGDVENYYEVCYEELTSKLAKSIPCC